MEFIKLFETHSEYETYINSTDKLLPNLSYCEDNDCVHFNPFVPPETRIVAKYNVVDDTETTLLYGYYTEEGEEEAWVIGSELFDRVEIDNVEVSVSDLDTAEGKYQLSAGEHTVKYTLKDPTSIGYGVFYECTSLTNIEIPNSVTSIDAQAFQDCSGLTSVTIPDSVTSIGQSAFVNCTGLISITSLATNAPTIFQRVFYNTNNCPIYVPSESVEAYKTATNWSSLASRIQAIP